MVTHLLEVRVPAPVAAPHGARVAAAVALWLGASARAVWQGAQRYGHHRAGAHLRRLASERQASNPELAAQLREAATWLKTDLTTEVKTEVRS